MRFILFSTIMFLVSAEMTFAAAGSLWVGEVTSSTGQLYTAGWKACEISVQNQTEELMQIQVTLIKNQESKSEALILKKYSTQNLFNGFYEYGVSQDFKSEVPLISLHNTHQVKFKDGNSSLIYKFQNSAYGPIGKIYTHELICETKAEKL